MLRVALAGITGSCTASTYFLLHAGCLYIIIYNDGTSNRVLIVRLSGEVPQGGSVSCYQGGRTDWGFPNGHSPQTFDSQKRVNTYSFSRHQIMCAMWKYIYIYLHVSNIIE